MLCNRYRCIFIHSANVFQSIVLYGNFCIVCYNNNSSFLHKLKKKQLLYKTVFNDLVAFKM